MKAGFGLMVWHWLSGCNVDREEAAGGSCGGGFIFADQWWLVFRRRNLRMSSGSQSRSRSPQDRKIRNDRFSYRNAPYRRDSRQGFRFSDFQSFIISSS